MLISLSNLGYLYLFIRLLDIKLVKERLSVRIVTVWRRNELNFF